MSIRVFLMALFLAGMGQERKRERMSTDKKVLHKLWYFGAMEFYATAKSEFELQKII